MRIPIRRPVFHEHEDLEDGRRRTTIWQRPVRFLEGGTEKPIRFALDEREILPGFGLCFDDIAIGGFRAFARPGRALMTISDVDRMLEFEPTGITPTRAADIQERTHSFRIYANTMSPACFTAISGRGLLCFTNTVGTLSKNTFYWSAAIPKSFAGECGGENLGLHRRAASNLRRSTYRRRF